MTFNKDIKEKDKLVDIIQRYINLCESTETDPILEHSFELYRERAVRIIEYYKKSFPDIYSFYKDNYRRYWRSGL